MDTGDSNEGAGSLPPKQLRLECIIHCSDDNTDKLVSLQNIDSWRTLLRAAEIQKHIPVLELAQDLPDGQMGHSQITGPFRDFCVLAVQITF